MTGRKIAWIPRFTSHYVASTRIRCLNVIRGLRNRGFEAELFTPEEFNAYQVLVFLKAYGKEHIALAKKAKAAGKKVVLDLCDNHFIKANDSLAESERVHCLDAMLDISDVVVVSTEALGKVVAERHPTIASKISVIGDSVEDVLPRSRLARRPIEWMALFLLRLFVRFQRRIGRTPLVWFGIHGGDNAEYGMQDVLKISDQLNAVAKVDGISLTIISNNYRKYLSISRAFKFPSFYMPWGGSTFFSALALHRIALIPVTVNEFTACKSNNRVALAISRGLAVVTSTLIPAYEELMPYIKLGDMGTGVSSYIADPMRVDKDVSAGKIFIAKNYTLEPIIEKWGALLGKLGLDSPFQGAI
jgi:hypothetical protein